MSAQPKHRDKIVRAAALLFRRQGYAGTGMNEIVALSGAPKGSVYHYFPQGKEQIAEETVRYASELVTKTLSALAEKHARPAAMVRAYGEMLVHWLAESDYQDGCPIMMTLLEMSVSSPSIEDAGRAAFDAWKKIYRAKLSANGVPEKRAAALASMAVISFQGALVLAKVERSPQPILDATAEMAHLFEAACKG